MHIQTLELHGFKSFPNRTTLHFGQGISCIVGPNGCGKSNIVDAVRWCIGEQSAKSLRGDDRLDVLFSGSSNRKSVGFAEVVLTFTADPNNPFPGDYQPLRQLSVGRRLHRNGISEYAMNQRRVRRRDVVDLFLDCGIGNNLYSIIEQGRIDTLIHAKPQQRRSLIDEAAGISKYKARRQEAQHRLQATLVQLDRVADVVETMRERLVVLVQQAAKSAAFRRTNALIRQHEIALTVAKYAALRETHSTSSANTCQTMAQIEQLLQREQEYEQSLVLQREALNQAASQVASLRDQLATCAAQERAQQSTQGLTEQHRAALNERHQQAQQQLANARQTGDALRQTNTELHNALAQLLQQLDAAERDVEQASHHANHCETTARTCATALQTLTQAQIHSETRLQAIQAQLTALRERAEVLPEQLYQQAQQVAGFQRDHAHHTQVHQQALAALQQLSRERDAFVAEQARCQPEVEARAERLVQAQARVAQAENQLYKVEARSASVIAEARIRADSTREAAAQAQAKGDALRSARLQTLREEHDRALETVVAQQDDLLRQATERADAFERGAEAYLARRLQACQQRFDRAERDLEQTLANRLTAAREAEDLAVQQARASASGSAQPITQAGQTLQAATAHRTSCEEALEIALQAKWEAARAEGQAQVAVGQSEAALAQLRRGTKGAEAVAQVLQGVPTLGDLTSPQDPRSWLATVLGKRLNLPVVAEVDAVLRAAKAAEQHGTAAVVVVRQAAEPLQAVLNTTPSFETLAHAVTHFLATGQPGVVRATGERVDADGVVHLGPASKIGERTLAVQRDLARATAELTQLTEQARQTRETVAACHAQVDHAKGQQALAAEALAKAKQQAETQRQAAVEAARQQATKQLKAELQHAEKAREAFVAKRAAVLEALRTYCEQERAATRARREQVLLDLRRQHLAARAQTQQALDTQAAAEREAIASEVETLVANRREQAEAAQAAWLAATENALAVAKAEGVVAVAEADRARVAEQLARHRDQHAALQATVDEVHQAIQKQETALAAQQQAFADCQAQHTQAAARHQQAEQVLATAREQQVQAQVAVATLGERVASARQSLADLAEREQQTAEHALQAQQSLAQLAQESKATEQSLASIHQTLQTLADEHSRVTGLLTHEQAQLDTLRHQLAETEQALRQVRTEREVQSTTLAKQQSEVSLTKQSMQQLQDQLDERYQLPLAERLETLRTQGKWVLQPGASVREPLTIGGQLVNAVEPLVLTLERLRDATVIKQWVREITTLREALTRFGEVNLAALSEYDELSKRHRDLAQQHADLDASVVQIRSAIAKMNRTCRRRFRDTFDHLNERFQVMYPSLVGGGEARLSLTTEEDLLEAGVDIIAQPPGKRLQNMNLLSGGEKAMVAIALILALFQVKPSPFCVLDEVDAPLDEANGSRFNEALRAMATRSQFIVITHNRKTMECADTLYGITMPTPGVSKLVSVQL